MRGILADVNVQGQVAVLATVLDSPAWRDVWRSLFLQGLQHSGSKSLGLVIPITEGLSQLHRTT